MPTYGDRYLTNFFLILHLKICDEFFSLDQYVNLCKLWCQCQICLQMFESMLPYLYNHGINHRAQWLFFLECSRNLRKIYRSFGWCPNKKAIFYICCSRGRTFCWNYLTLPPDLIVLIYSCSLLPKQNEEYKTHEQGYHQLSDSEPFPPRAGFLLALPLAEVQDMNYKALPGLDFVFQTSEAAHYKNPRMFEIDSSLGKIVLHQFSFRKVGTVYAALLSYQIWKIIWWTRMLKGYRYCTMH